MKRRTLMGSALAAAGASVLPAPSIAQSSRAGTLRFVPQANLSILDPHFTTAGVTLNHAYCVFDTLYGTDENFQVHPQMAAGHEVSDDGMTWTIKLRPGLKFHDGSPVRAADCVASLKRWSRRDTYGATLAAAVAEWQAADDSTIRIRLQRRFPRLLEAIAHPGPIGAFIMPERLAQTDAFKLVTEMVGSGPYRFVADEYVSGSRVVYTKFADYVPRDEPASWNSGGKRVYFDRLEWQVIPDDSTAASALQTGEVDWLEDPSSDIATMLVKSKDIVVQFADRLGSFYLIRFNSLVPPFNNAKLRHAVLAAADQSEFLAAITASPSEYRLSPSMFPMGVPDVNPVGASLMKAPKDMAAAKQAIKDAGYQGEKVVILDPSDQNTMGPLSEVAADLLQKLGMNVDLQTMDWGTVGQRRTSRETVDHGGWSIFITSWPSVAIANPATNTNIRGQGGKGWFGWYDSPRIEQLTQTWLDAVSPSQQQTLMDDIQRVAFDEAPIVPLGIVMARTAFRKELTGVLPGPAMFLWNVRRG